MSQTRSGVDRIVIDASLRCAAWMNEEQARTTYDLLRLSGVYWAYCEWRKVKANTIVGNYRVPDNFPNELFPPDDTYDASENEVVMKALWNRFGDVFNYQFEDVWERLFAQRKLVNFVYKETYNSTISPGWPEMLKDLIMIADSMRDKAESMTPIEFLEGLLAEYQQSADSERSGLFVSMEKAYCAIEFNGNDRKLISQEFNKYITKVLEERPNSRGRTLAAVNRWIEIKRLVNSGMTAKQIGAERSDLILSLAPGKETKWKDNANKRNETLQEDVISANAVSRAKSELRKLVRALENGCILPPMRPPV